MSVCISIGDVKVALVAVDGRLLSRFVVSGDEYHQESRRLEEEVRGQGTNPRPSVEKWERKQGPGTTSTSSNSRLSLFLLFSFNGEANIVQLRTDSLEKRLLPSFLHYNIHTYNQRFRLDRNGLKRRVCSLQPKQTTTRVTRGKKKKEISMISVSSFFFISFFLFLLNLLITALRLFPTAIGILYF